MTVRSGALDLDTRVLSEYIYALNIARRQVAAYPPGHPIVVSAAEKLLALLNRLLEFRDEISIGIARDTLMVGDQVLEAGNPVYRDLAVNLFNSRIASLTMNKQATAEEIFRFFEILSRKTEQLTDLGGLDRVLASSNIRGIHAKGVDFDAFHATEVDQVHAPKTSLAESETAVMWRSFVGGLLADTLDPDGVARIKETQVDPALLAEVMNHEFKDGNQNIVNAYDSAITAFLKQADREQIRSQACHDTLGRLGDLVGRLAPELRRRFLNSTLKSCADRQDVGAAVLGQLPQTLILEAMDQVDTEQLVIPQGLMDVLGKLALTRQGQGVDSRVAGKSVRSAEHTADLLGRLFKQGGTETYVPDDYQGALSILASAEIEPGLDPKLLDELVETLDGHKVERQFCRVMLGLLDHGATGNAQKAISRNMEGLIFYFLDTGDFHSLNNVYDHLERHARNVDELRQTADKTALQVFSSIEFIDQALDGLETWGKPEYGAIQGLIKRVGAPFAEPLLNRLAEEQGMSKRRLIMECLLLIGPPARDAIAARLHDQRWYFVRNLVVLLRDMNDPVVLHALGRLVGHAHPKVQYEVMTTFLHFRDPRADRYLLKELESRDAEVLYNAVRLAAKSQLPEVARKLSQLLNARLGPDADERVKLAVVKSLAEMALPEALPELGKFLRSRSLFSPLQQNRVKIEAVKSLEHYKDPQAALLAEEISTKSSGDLARAAGKVCLQLKGKPPWT